MTRHSCNDDAASHDNDDVDQHSCNCLQVQLASQEAEQLADGAKRAAIEEATAAADQAEAAAAAALELPAEDVQEEPVPDADAEVQRQPRKSKKKTKTSALGRQWRRSKASSVVPESHPAPLGDDQPIFEGEGCGADALDLGSGGD